MRVIGIDPGLAATGYGVIQFDGGGLTLMEAGVVNTAKRDPLERRIFTLHAELVQILSEFRPDIMVVESLYSHYRHPRTSIIMGHARGVLLLAAAQAGIEVRNYPATTIKVSLTGNGRASKEQMQEMVRYRLILDDVPRPADAADALACAICHINHEFAGVRSSGA